MNDETRKALQAAAEMARQPFAFHPAPELAATIEALLAEPSFGYIVTLETRHFSFEAHGTTEEEANEVMGRALTRHAETYALAPDWWSEYSFQTRLFRPGFATRDDDVIEGDAAEPVTFRKDLREGDGL